MGLSLTVDERQSLFRQRGDAFSPARELSQAHGVVTYITEPFGVSPQLVQCSRRLIQMNGAEEFAADLSDPPPPESAAAPNQSQPIETLAFDSKRSEAEGIAAKVQDLLSREGVDPSDIAVIARMSADAAAVVAPLRARGVEVVDCATPNNLLVESVEVRFLLALLRTLYDPDRNDENLFYVLSSRTFEWGGGGGEA